MVVVGKKLVEDCDSVEDGVDDTTVVGTKLVDVCDSVEEGAAAAVVVITVEEDCNGVVTVLHTTAVDVDDDVVRSVLRTAVVGDDTGSIVVVDDDLRPQHLNTMARCQ